MLSFSMPTIFARGWFWLAVIAVVIVINYFWGKPLPPAKPYPFFLKHRKIIYGLTDALIILLIVHLWLQCVVYEVNSIRRALSDPDPIRRAINLPFERVFLLYILAVTTGLSGFLLGLLSVFRSNLTKIKRLILLFISLLPMFFTILALLICRAEDRWYILQLGLLSSVHCWFFNGPAIIAGKHFLVVGWMVMRALRVVSGEFPS